MGGKIASFKTKCRENDSQIVQVGLKEAANFGPAYQYTYKLENIPKHAEVIVAKYFSVNQNKTTMSSPEDSLEF